jgi:hypothetical protein
VKLTGNTFVGHFQVTEQFFSTDKAKLKVTVGYIDPAGSASAAQSVEVISDVTRTGGFFLSVDTCTHAHAPVKSMSDKYHVTWWTGGRECFEGTYLFN